MSITYRVEHSPTVDFDKAPARMVDRGAFRVTLDNGKATVEMIDHFASLEEAREVVDPFLCAWEFTAELRQFSDRFRFVFETADLIDRAPPPPGGRQVQSAALGMSASSAVAFGGHVSHGQWPDPPQGIALSGNEVDLMRRRWVRYKERGEPLLAATYWALTILEAAPGIGQPSKRRGSKKRRDASAFFNVDLDVLDKLGELTSTRGGDDEARKAEGRLVPLSPLERQWVENAFRALVHRVAEREYHGGPPTRPLTMRDILPKLTP